MRKECVVWAVFMSAGQFACTGGGGSPRVAPTDDSLNAIQERCVVRAEMPLVKPLFSSKRQLCAASHGQSLPANLVPPVSSPQSEPDYVKALREFVVSRTYASNEYNWLHDLTWRLTGPYQGCQAPDNGQSFGVHPVVRIYYSPEIVDWLCSGRATDLGPGAMIVKEMRRFSKLDTLGVDSQGLMWVPQDLEATDYTVMVKARGASVDDWYWAGFLPGLETGNPPIVGPSATYGDDITRRDAAYYPTGNQLASGKKSSQVFPYYGFGNYCINCHASAISQSTYSTLENILGVGLRYEWLGRRTPPSEADPRHGEASAAGTRQGWTEPLKEANREFLTVFPQLRNVPFTQVLASRFPAETYDHAVSRGDERAVQEFVTSDQCLGCHDATANRGVLPEMVYENDDGTQTNLSPWAEWRASPMGLAGRDPIFFAQLESEVNLFSMLGSRYNGDLEEQLACIQNTCLHCHGVMGQRQLTIDNPGSKERCEHLLPTKAARLFIRDMVRSWRDQSPADAKYGGLARDGISCAVCHHMSAEALGTTETFTGNFIPGPPDSLYGPFEDPRRVPMEHALGITPTYGEQITDSKMCGSCHAIELPVYDDDGNFVKTSYEQTTYLEWLNSDMTDISCQECHMPNTFRRPNDKLSYKIANIEDSSYPDTENRLPDEEIDLPDRPYRRHLLYGLNLFLNEMFQQFPILLGLRQLDYMNGTPISPLLTAREEALKVAQHQTADVRIGQLSLDERAAGATLTAELTVENKVAHNLPSGVGFRRLFVEFLVLGEDADTIWASGRTSNLGVILDGVSDTPLSTEFLSGLAPDSSATCQERQRLGSYQVHHDTISSGSQVQIYEELTATSRGAFTTSFLHRYDEVKDNRLRPRGWRWDKQLPDSIPIHELSPKDPCTLRDPDYARSTAKLPGSDKITYQIPLSPAQAARVRMVKATLYSQSIPPYYLKQRFEIAGRPGNASEDAQRLYYITSHFNADGAIANNGQRFLKGWKLYITGDQKGLHFYPPRTRRKGG